MAEPPNVLLHLTNKPENVLLVREMLSGLAQAVDLDPSDLNDVHTGVTEACNNVVLHAYEGEEGPLEVEVSVQEGRMEVVVRDHGSGILERDPSIDGSSIGIGLPVIHALTESFQLTSTEPSGGTEAKMEFSTPGTRRFQASAAEDFEPLALGEADPSSTVTVSVVPLELARAVLARLLSAIAVYAHFSTDQISDLQLVSDALVAHVPSSMNSEHLNVAVSVEPRNLELKVGPLGLGSAQRLIGSADLDGIGGVIEKLSDRQAIARSDSYEVLTLALVGRH